MKNPVQPHSLFHPAQVQAMRSASGFTLIEVMITVAIIAIIGAIALPAYSSYVIQGKIPDALSNLGGKALQIEQFYLDNRTYVGATQCTSDTTTSRYFDFACTSSTSTGFQLVATGKSSMLGFSFAISQNNGKSTIAVPTDWSLPSPNNCWITKKGGVC
jgi:type IV pilus assembly protein PilE